MLLATLLFRELKRPYFSYSFYITHTYRYIKLMFYENIDLLKFFLDSMTV
mgnify:CR=1 FL=1